MENKSIIKIKNSPTNKILTVESTDRLTYTISAHKNVMLRFGTHKLEVDGWELKKAIDNCLNI